MHVVSAPCERTARCLLKTIADPADTQSVINVRRATVDDFESIVAVYTAAWRAGFGFMFSAAVFARDTFDQERQDECRDIVFSDETDTFVVEVDDRVAGFSACRRTRFDMELEDLWIHPTSWGTGAANALLSRAEHDLRSIGGVRLTAWVPEDSPRGRFFFDKVGWKPTGVSDTLDVYGHESNRLLEYERVLSPIDQTRGMPRPAVRV